MTMIGGVPKSDQDVADAEAVKADEDIDVGSLL